MSSIPKAFSANHRKPEWSGASLEALAQSLHNGLREYDWGQVHVVDKNDEFPSCLDEKKKRKKASVVYIRKKKVATKTDEITSLHLETKEM